MSPIKKILNQRMDRRTFFVRIGSFLLVIGWVGALAKLISSSGSEATVFPAQSSGYGSSSYGASDDINKMVKQG